MFRGMTIRFLAAVPPLPNCSTDLCVKNVGAEIGGGWPGSPKKRSLSAHPRIHKKTATQPTAFSVSCDDGRQRARGGVTGGLNSRRSMGQPVPAAPEHDWSL